MNLSLRGLAPADLSALEALVCANRPLFTDDECRIASEVIRETLDAGEDPDGYQFIIAECTGRVVGFVCFGTIPLTRGSYDLYWIVVDPALHRQGIGRRLLAACEDRLARHGGRLIVAETSSMNPGAQWFYEKTMGYRRVARIEDFYTAGEDKLVYVKRLETGR